MRDVRAAQAIKLVHALNIHLIEMTNRLTTVQRRDARRPAHRSGAAEAATLRRDIAEAQMLIAQLHRRYLTPPIPRNS